MDLHVVVDLHKRLCLKQHIDHKSYSQLTYFFKLNINQTFTNPVPDLRYLCQGPQHRLIFRKVINMGGGGLVELLVNGAD